jgi:hypothetical protein
MQPLILLSEPSLPEEGRLIEEREYYSVLFALQEVSEYFLKLFWHSPAWQERREV